MTIFVRTEIARPDEGLVSAFKGLPASIVSDVMNRMNAMHASIKPVQKNVHMVGTAITIKAMVGDNLATHQGIYYARKGDVLVIDARGGLEASVWGFLQTRAATLKGIAGIVIDGAIRDVAEIRDSTLPIFCKGVTAAGPHKGWGGSINERIQCGGVPVNPGDIVLGDDDGVVVVPRESAASVLENAKKCLKEEAEWFKRVEAGERTVDILGLERDIKRDVVKLADEQGVEDSS